MGSTLHAEPAPTALAKACWLGADRSLASLHDLALVSGMRGMPAPATQSPARLLGRRRRAAHTWLLKRGWRRARSLMPHDGASEDSTAWMSPSTRRWAPLGEWCEQRLTQPCRRHVGGPAAEQEHCASCGEIVAPHGEINGAGAPARAGSSRRRPARGVPASGCVSSHSGSRRTLIPRAATHRSAIATMPGQSMAAPLSPSTPSRSVRSLRRNSQRRKRAPRKSARVRSQP